MEMKNKKFDFAFSSCTNLFRPVVSAFSWLLLRAFHGTLSTIRRGIVCYHFPVPHSCRYVQGISAGRVKMFPLAEPRGI